MLKPEQFVSDDPRAKSFTFDTITPESRGVQKIMQNEGELSAKGDLANEFTLEPTEVLYGRIEVESAVRDDRGKYVANTASAAFVRARPLCRPRPVRLGPQGRRARQSAGNRGG